MSTFMTPTHIVLCGCLAWHSLCNIRTHLSMLVPSRFLVIVPPRDAEINQSFWTCSGFIHEKGTPHTCIWAHNLIECTHVRKEFLPASALKQTLPELPVLLNPILKERFTPHVWEAPGIGRECTHKGTYTNTICMPDAMLNQWSKQTHLGTWNSIAVCLLLLV